MRKTLIIAFLFLLVATLVVFVADEAMTKEKRGSSLSKAAVIDRPLWNPNRIAVYITNDGQTVSNIPTSSAGLEWPAGSHNTAHYAGGIWLAGMKNDAVVTACGEFVTEFNAGNVVDGVAANSQDPAYKVYIINQADVANPLGNDDYLNWPVEHGAPVNADGTPQLLGTSTAWAVFNDFDAATHNNLFQTAPMNVEVQMTAWAFDRPDAFGDMLFYKYKFINKGDANIDSAFVGLWNDIDVGDASDLVGCDTTLGLGFMYKTQADGLYGDNPPAIGMDFFQGPIVPSPGDVANVSGKAVPDFKNLTMSSFAKYINGGPPQYSDPEVGAEAYNFMNGYDLLGDPIIDDVTGQETKFWHAGDPVTGEGWLDPSHADKRFLMNAGPFTLAVGDTQEVVFGIMIAQGTTGTQSVELLKQADQIAQLAYDINFALPPSPQVPEVTWTAEPTSITLQWDAGQEDYTAEDLVDIDTLGNPTYYTFQGYNVYQTDSPVITGETTVKKIASYDLIDGITQIRDDVFVGAIGQTVNMVVQDATDSGLRRYLTIDTDAVRGGVALIENRKYYFAVTAYGYNPNGIPKTLEAPLQMMTIRPQAAGLGTDLSAAAAVGDTLSIARVAGGSDGTIVPIVYDRTQLTGHTYEVRFRELTAGPDSGSLVYDVVDVNTGEVKAEGFTNQSDSDGTDNYPLVDGVQVRVLGAPPEFKDFQMVANAAGPIDPPEGAAADFQGFPSLRPTDGQQVGSGHWFVNAGGGTGSYESFLGRALRGNNAAQIVPYDWEVRFTSRGSWAVRAFEDGALTKVPFEVWNIGNNTPDDPSDDFRCILWFLSNGGVGGLQTDPDGLTYQVDPNDHGASGGTDDPYTPWVYWRVPAEHLDGTPGEAGYNAFLTQIDTTLAFQAGVDAGGSYGYDGAEALARTVLVNWNGDDVSDGVVEPGTQLVPEEGSVIRLISTKPNSTSDVFSFESIAPITSDNALAKKQAAELVNVFPNPYTGVNEEETNPVDRFVTFTHLPESGATIQIFTLLGELVRTIDHEGGSQFATWDMENESNIPVASGIYIARISMPGIGSKILKLGVMHPEERLDIF